MTRSGGTVRSDNGGALDRRAQGDLKATDEWGGGSVKEFESMRKKDKSTYARLIDKEIADSVRTLAFSRTPQRIDRAMAAAHYPEKQRAGLRRIILERID